MKHETYKRIKNIRYGKPGLILFNFNRMVHTIREPTDVILVGVNPELAAKWIWDKYGCFLLCGLKLIR